MTEIQKFADKLLNEKSPAKDDYKPNSYKYKEEQKETGSNKKVEKIIEGVAKAKSKNELQKFADAFMSDDLKSYIFMDVLVPSVKKAISDIVTNGIDMILYGENGKIKKNSNSSRVSYRSYYNKDNERKDYRSERNKPGYSYSDVILDNRGEAEEVLSRMDELISVYGLVSIADLYDLVGITGNYTDNKYGWTDIRSASVMRVRDGYLLKLPKALPLN